VSAPDSRKDAFYQVVEATLRALGLDAEVSAAFDEKFMGGMTGTVAQLTSLPQGVKRINIGQIRGEADAIALKLRYHDPELHAQCRPRGRTARALYEAVEQARVESLGACKLPGVAINLADSLELECKARGYETVKDRTDVPIDQAVGLYLREALTGERITSSARDIVDLWKPWFKARATKNVESLQETIFDQDAFQLGALELIEALGFGDEEQDEDDEEQDQEEQYPDDTEVNDDSDSDEAEGDSQGESSDEQMDGSGEGDMEEDGAMDDEGVTGEGGEETEQPGRSMINTDGGPGDKPSYRAFTTKYDEVVHADALCDPAELARLRAILDERLSSMHGAIGRLANRLQRRLLAQQSRSWEFDLEEGLLDCARLSRVVTNPMAPLTFKMEKETEFRDTVVSLLIDNSGSMRGRPIMVAAMSGDILARTLERCGVRTEILGFTTRAWKGGQSREAWLSQDRPSMPGRLNDLRHIVYKTADMPYRRARNNLGLMLREGLLKENVDAEALLWAHQRLLARPEQRRILMVISDGAPVDDSTLSANPRNYLERHLIDVVNWMEAKSEVDIIAIGIGHDVARYYQRAVTISDAEQLGSTMLEQLTDLFSEEDRMSRAATKRRGRPRHAA
jgi:cobaltochelatase CobT